MTRTTKGTQMLERHYGGRMSVDLYDRVSKSKLRNKISLFNAQQQDVIVSFYEDTEDARESNQLEVEKLRKAIEEHPDPTTARLLVLVKTGDEEQVQVTKIVEEMQIQNFKLGKVDFEVNEEFEGLMDKLMSQQKQSRCRIL